MSEVITTPPVVTTPTTARIVGRWMVSFLGFPLGGFAAVLLTDPVNSASHAVLGGLITGVVLGAVQSWGLRFGRHELIAWTVATALGLAVGLALGAALVEFGTSMRDLALQGAVTGAMVGLAQATVLRRQLGRLAFAWPFYLAGAWAVGWVVTTAGGIAVEDQFTTFGSFGALTVAFLTLPLPIVLASRANIAEKSSS